MGLNHIYKVIWSKTKNAWVVVSEIAKRDGKSSVKSVVTSLAGKSVAAVMVAMVMCGGVASANTAYGTGATATGSNSTAIGDNASATGSGGVAMGNGSSANEGVAIGDNSLSQFKSIAMGPNAKSGQYSVSIGELADTTEAGSMRNVAIGYRSKATDDGSISIGPNATAKGSTSIAIGSQAETGRQGSIAMGYAVRNAQDNAISIGSAVTNYSDHTVAIGHNVNIAAGAKYGTAIGVLSKINGGLRNTSIGYNNYVANGGDTSTFGSGNKVAGTYTTVIGTDNNYGSNVSVANRSGIFGYHNILNATSGAMEDSYIIGANNEVNARRTIVLGNNITVPADMENAVVLGDRSNSTPYSQASDVTVGGVTLESMRFAGNVALSKGSILSIGSIGTGQRQIKNVAAGVISSTSTDAVNGSQLYEAVRAVSAGASPDVYMHVNDGTTTQGAGNAMTNLGKANEKGGATGNYAIAGGVNAAASGENSIAIGRMSYATANWGVALGYQSRNNAGSSIAIGSYAEVSKKNSIAIGSADFTTSTPSSPLPTGGTVVNGEFSIALAAGAQISGDSSIGIGRGVTIEGNSNIGIGKYIATQNLYGIQSENNVAIGSGSGVIGQKSVVIGYNGDGAASNIHPSIFANESVIIGTNSTIFDGSSLPTSLSDLGVGNHMIGNRNRISYHTNNALVVGNDSSAKGDDAIAIGHGAKALAEESISIGTGNEVKGAKSSAIGDPSYIDTTATGTHVQGNNNGTSTNPIKASESTFMGNTNLAGTAGTTGIHVVGNSNSVDSSNVMVMGNNVTVGTGLDGAVVLGHASSADQYAAATDSTINGVTFEAAGYAGNTGLNKGSIVSVGATGTERQIKNVAAGAVTATSTDAVNGSQLYKTAETILKMPINMAGDSGDTVGLKLGKTVNIKGSVASGADVTDGNIAVVGDKATSTLSLKMAKNLTGLTSGTFTDATGNQTVINGAGVTVTPTGTGATPISITTSGINAGNQEIKGVKKGTTDDAAVNKKQMDDALAGISSTLTINDGTTDGSVNIKTGKLKVVGESGANALVTTTVSGDTITVGTSTKLQNAVTAAEKSADKDLSNLSATGSDKVKTLAQDAVKVAGTGLATVSDATAASVKTYTVNVDEGKLVIDDTTGKVGAAGASQGTVQGKDGVATTQNVASVVNSAIDKTKQALDDAKHNFAGDDSTVISRKHGEQLNIKGGASTTASDLTSGNIAVVGDTTSGTLNIKMAKALTGLTSATYTDAAGNTQTVTGGSSTISDAAGNSTVVSKGGVTTTDAAGNTTTTAPTGVTVTPAGTGTTPISVTTSGISAGNKEIKNVANGTTDDAAVNKKQMDDALKGATDNTVSLGSESGSTTAKKLSTTGGIKFNIKGETGANALITTSATGDDVTIAPTAKLTAAVTAAEKSADKDLSNLSAAGDTYIKNLAKTAASWNVETNGAGTTAVAGGDTVNFINGDNIAITNTGRSITIGTAKNVSFDKVTVGGVVIDKTDGINAGGKEIKGVATGTAADSAVNKAQMDAAITAAAGGSLSTEKVVAKTLTGDNNLATVTGQTGTAKGETYEVSVSENAVKAVAATAAQDAVKVAGTGLATVSDATAAGVKTYTVNVDEGKLVIDDTTGKLGAAGATQGTVQGKNGVATTQNVADVVNSAIDKTKQALTDAKHDFAGDDATVISRKHGEQLNIKGGASTTATDLTSGNIAVVGDTTSGTLNIKMAKALTGLTSATYTDAAGNTQTVTGGSSTISDAAGNSTVVSKGGVTTTDGTNTTTVAPAGVTATDGTHTVTLGGAGISAGGTEIKNVGKATTDDAAVNKKQMDDALKGATDNTVSLGSESGSTTAKKLSTTGGIKFNIKGETGANALITTSATGDDVTIAPTAKLTAAVTAAEKSADKDLSNISTAGETVIKNLAATSAQDAVKVTGTGLATVSDSTTGGVKTYNV
ncbi:MAG: ESPR-type extended signal peptide-containing protein, partial [Veillonella sp.]|uniref:ESPR-type extended signal peptide-containing protein n=1 Tax=Veillonella sp. TaxID=1926307 RepID=UPI00290903C4